MHSIHRTLATPLLLSAAVLLALGVLLEPAGVMAQDAGAARFTYLFRSDAEGWVTGFADLPIDYEQRAFDLDAGYRALPDGLHQSRGMFMQGRNRGGLFMYLKRQVDGLRPNTEYTVSVTVDIATNVPAGLIGIGGAPGESVFVKAGASTIEPTASAGADRRLRMNIDKGNQSQGGVDMVVIGNVAHSGVTGSEYRLKFLENVGQPLSVQTDGNGRVWLIVGTDSGFEGLTAVYYARIAYTLTGPQASSAPGAALPNWAIACVAAIGGGVVAISVALLARRRRSRV